jgi:Ribbon-helix-helix domain
MAAKRPSLAESMKALKSSDTLPGIPPSAQGAGAPKPYFAASRAGKRRLTLIVEPADHKRLKHLSADTDRSIEDLLREALEDLLRKHKA